MRGVGTSVSTHGNPASIIAAGLLRLRRANTHLLTCSQSAPGTSSRHPFAPTHGAGTQQLRDQELQTDHGITSCMGTPLAMPSARDQPPRIRGRKLQRIRAEHFARHPLCVHCERKGITRPAEQLDHIVSLYCGGKDVPENRQGLCRPCHDKKTLLDLGLHKRTCFDKAGRVVW